MTRSYLPVNSGLVRKAGEDRRLEILKNKGFEHERIHPLVIRHGMGATLSAMRSLHICAQKF